MEKEIEKAIRETLVVVNSQSIHIAVEKIKRLIEKEKEKEDEKHTR